MIILQAPYDLLETTIFLPSPSFGDTLSLRLGLNRKVSINNVRYTYVKRKNRQKIDYTFLITREKSFELQVFVKDYVTAYLKLTNHKNEIWKMRFVSDPFTYVAKTRDERIEILLSFEGILINGSVINC